MKSKPGKVQIYTVVEVWRGIASGARNFTSVAAAEAYQRRVRHRQNAADDDVAIFKNKLRLSR